MSDYKNCPYCGEEILADAKKCKHCGEWLSDKTDNASNGNADTVAANRQQTVVQEKTNQMGQSKIDMFVMANKEYFTPQQMMLIKERLSSLTEEKTQQVFMTSFRNPTTILILSLLFGGLGVDRFMIGETGLGIAKLLTFGGCGIWAIIDWFIIQKKTREYNFQKFNESLMY